MCIGKSSIRVYPIQTVLHLSVRQFWQVVETLFQLIRQRQPSTKRQRRHSRIILDQSCIRPLISISLKYIPKPKMAGTQIAVNIPSIRCPLNQRYPETKNEISTPNKRNKSAFLNINKPPLIVTVRKNTNQTTKNRETCWYPYMCQTPTFEFERNKTEQSTDCVRHSSDNQHPADSDENEANGCSTFSVRFHPLIIFGNVWRRCKRCRTESFFDYARERQRWLHMA